MSTGVGLIWMDIALFMSVVGAFGINAYYIPSCWRVGRGIAVMRLLRMTGWLIVSTRYGYVLFTTGDILISAHTAIGIFFLAAGEVAALFNRGKQVPL